MRRLVLAPGERAEIVVDFSDDLGVAVVLMAYNSELGIAYVPDRLSDALDRSDFEIFTMVPGTPTDNPVTSLPQQLAPIGLIAETEAVNGP